MEICLIANESLLFESLSPIKARSELRVHSHLPSLSSYPSRFPLLPSYVIQAKLHSLFKLTLGEFFMVLTWECAIGEVTFEFLEFTSRLEWGLSFHCLGWYPFVGSLALQDAEVPIKCPIVGLAMGLVLESEDASRDMEFKLASNKMGITAFQMDIKDNIFEYKLPSLQ
uniref:Uncharacterized protein n=1 Tax=Cucumis melo TaxID=3656 RepID=A0A9I9EK21_CUCME